MKRNPLLPLHPPLTPPAWRSRAALAQTSFAARGLFRMQVCGECDAVQHPVREACFACLGDALAWRDVPRGGVLAAATVVRVSADPYFRRRMPWPVGTVVMDAGPRVQAHLLGGVAPGERVVLRQMLDKAGRSVMLAAPEGREVAEDAVLAELSCDPKERRVLIVDGRGVGGLALARAMREAGAREVFVGVAVGVTVPVSVGVPV